MEHPTFLVEHYLPGRRLAELETFARKVCEVDAVRVLQATVVPEDESVLCVVASPSETAVRAAYQRAGIQFDRISPAIAHDQPRKGESDVH
ncbi:MAG TPA: nickel-binding protein [Gaiellaceae bacterium]|nr:nickel-binding protein [Gaiellaceae bacterium]